MPPTLLPKEKGYVNFTCGQNLLTSILTSLYLHLITIVHHLNFVLPSCCSIQSYLWNSQWMNLINLADRCFYFQFPFQLNFPWWIWGQAGQNKGINQGNSGQKQMLQGRSSHSLLSCEKLSYSCQVRCFEKRTARPG